MGAEKPDKKDLLELERRKELVRTLAKIVGWGSIIFAACFILGIYPQFTEMELWQELLNFLNYSYCIFPAFGLVWLLSAGAFSSEFERFINLMGKESRSLMRQILAERSSANVSEEALSQMRERLQSNDSSDHDPLSDHDEEDEQYKES